MKTLSRKFFERDSTTVAKELLGHLLYRNINGNILIGRIVETESYLPFIDPAAHSYIGKTKRTSILYGEAGYSYVYSIHRYFCLNVVCDAVNIPGCVLIRALEPLKGIELMIVNRSSKIEANLTSGPGKLCQALSIDKNLNAIDVTNSKSELQILEGVSEVNNIQTTTRIGISKAVDLPLRFYIKNSTFVSKFI